ncbi:hypothetical protein [Streptomyces sp. MST-110588]|uniref:hypothetical protein n=1 Tax=Streptomyces sp. MST-110588 TaxID=2833628 RepID=UPI001F5D9972|nr:hypothetical protein [Streptomyces sp. MST-110588]UNO41532.1 hypothetical protein KGS77_20640 [Streptomyces sp. MST-110588]
MPEESEAAATERKHKAEFAANLDTQGRLWFVDQLDLDQPREPYHFKPRALHDTTKKRAAVNAGSLVSFVAGVSAQAKDDILNSVLLAQLAANKKYNRERDTVNWYAFYRNVLEHVGWALQAFEFTQYKHDEARFTMDKAVLKILVALLTGTGEYDVAKLTIEALKNLPEHDNRVVLFERESHEMRMGNFQIAVANETDTAVAVKMGAFYFTTTQDVTHILWAEFTQSSLTFYRGTQSMTLDTTIYAKVRDQIINKLGDRATQFVKDLEID